MIDVYATNVLCLKDKKLFRHLYSKIPNERKLKIDSYKFEKDKILSLGAWQLFCVVMKNKGISVDKIKIYYKENQKPYISPDVNLYFNLSHSGEYAVCAISEQDVGCDLQKIGELNMGFAKRFFTPHEYNFLLKEKNECNQKKNFYRLWTLKESFMKVTGYGAKLPLKDFNISIQKEITVNHKLELQQKYYFQEYSIQEDYCCSCCGLEKNFSPLKFIEIDS